jgi:hypothetical protein
MGTLFCVIRYGAIGSIPYKSFAGGFPVDFSTVLWNSNVDFGKPLGDMRHVRTECTRKANFGNVLEEFRLHKCIDQDSEKSFRETRSYSIAIVGTAVLSTGVRLVDISGKRYCARTTRDHTKISRATPTHAAVELRMTS